MAKKVKPEQISAAIAEQFTLYHQALISRINNLSVSAIKRVVKISKVSAPKQTGGYRKNIAYKQNEKNSVGNRSCIWYVKKPFHRLTHLLVHGHATVNGGRTKPDPFLKDALAEVLPEYEKTVEEAIKP